MICEILKKATSQYHSEAEKHLGATRIFDNDYSRNEYIKLLNILYMAHYGAEIPLSNFEMLDFRISEIYTQKHLFIKSDLTKMGGYSDSRIPTFNISNIFQAIGTLYVLKGSEMGTLMISKQLHKTFANSENISTDFYSYDSNIFNIWRDFCNTLDSLILSITDKENLDNANEQILEGAKNTYMFFIQCSLNYKELS